MYKKRGDLLDLRVAGPPGLAAWSNFWPVTAWGYELWRIRALTLLSGRSFPLEEEYRLMVEAVGPVQGASYLDLGTSTGLYSRALLAAGASRVYALDFSPAMLGQAIRKSAGVRGFIPLLASAQSLPLVDACLEGVVIGGSWNEFADLPLVAAEIARVLRPGGKLWLMFSQSQGLLGRVLKATGLHFPDLQETQQLLQSQGLTTRGWQERQVAFVVGCKALTGEGHRDLG